MTTMARVKARSLKMTCLSKGQLTVQRGRGGPGEAVPRDGGTDVGLLAVVVVLLENGLLGTNDSSGRHGRFSLCLKRGG